jgi:hypothetical protein
MSTRDEQFISNHCNILNRCFEQFFKKPLCEFRGGKPLFIDFDQTKRVIVSHGLENDPIFNYANKTALDLFEMNWSEFTSMPSRYSAEKLEREERDILLKEVSEKGYSSKYSGVRRSKSGRRFMINEAKVWNLIDLKGNFYGQAATFDRWNYI